MTRRFTSFFLKFACLLTLMGILCPAPNASFTLRLSNDVRVPVCTSISLQQLGQLIAAASTTKNVTDDSPMNRIYNQSKINTPLPEGYAPYRNSSVAYKVYEKEVSWVEAKKLCEKDGARLGIADSQETYIYFIHLPSNGKRIHVGIYRLFDKWVSVRDGSVVNDIPFESGHVDLNHGCVRTRTWDGLLETIPCHRNETYSQADSPLGYYLCEIEIPENTFKR
ncbi:uncharacterized protein LOC124414486 [Diprion similis]|uniref:uncharacterized protein LOC124414486 n=1 Tax=Diprion similis TaxID=362088 RepID=UPI001EF80D38|nr:uncharacterized protein LOC124414486 [Diprion similis]